MARRPTSTPEAFRVHVRLDDALGHPLAQFGLDPFRAAEFVGTSPMVETTRSASSSS